MFSRRVVVTREVTVKAGYPPNVILVPERFVSVKMGRQFYDAVSIIFKSDSRTRYVVGSNSRIFDSKKRVWGPKPFVAEKTTILSTCDVHVVLNRPDNPEMLIPANSERVVTVRVVKVFVRRAEPRNGFVSLIFEGDIAV